jgi:hypothetical protein
MCDLCVSFGLKSESRPTAAEPARETGVITKNDDGTYTLTLTERELANLTIRLALSVARGL